MISVRCPSCGKQLIWDDFQPASFRCTQCGTPLNVHQGLKANIRQRELVETGNLRRCPFCEGVVSRRWFVRCSACGHWLFGRFSIHGKWLFILNLAAAYLALTLYYVLVVH